MNTLQKLLKRNIPILRTIKLPKHFRTPKSIQPKESVELLPGDTLGSCPGFQVGKDQIKMLYLYLLVYLDELVHWRLG